MALYQAAATKREPSSATGVTGGRAAREKAEADAVSTTAACGT